MTKTLELKGHKFGRLTVLHPVGHDKRGGVLFDKLAG